MNNGVFLTSLFLPFLFSLYLIFRKLIFGYVNKFVLNIGLILSVFISLSVSVYKFIIDYNMAHCVLLITNIIFTYLTLLSVVYFKFKKKYMFTKIRYYIFILLFMSITQAYALSSNMIVSLFGWLISGILIYVFLYFDVFKKGADNNPNRFYSIVLIGDFCFLLCVLILAKYAIISDNFSYLLKYEDIKSLLSYIMGNGEFEYILLSVCFVIALFTRALIFPFSSLYSFLLGASDIAYLTIYSTIAPLYSLVLFLKLDLFSTLTPYFKIYFLVVIILTLFSLLFEKHFKIIFGYVLSIVNAIFIIEYFYSSKLAYIGLILAYSILIFGISILFLKNKTSFKKRAIDFNQGFIQERIIIFTTEILPIKCASIFDFIFNKTLNFIYKLIASIASILGFYYTKFSQKQNALNIIKGILVIFIFFALIATFCALFGNFGEMQS